MNFLALYGDELDRELATEDRSVRFTLARRKAAINAGQLEFLKRTECLQRQVSIALVSGTQEYDLEASISDFGWIAKQGIAIAITSGTTVRYLEGDDLRRVTVERLTVEEPSWRAATAATPLKYYLRRDGGTINLGLHPKPSIAGSDTWAALVPTVVLPADLSADSDEPFTISSNPVRSLRFWHRALVHFAAFDLEKFRKDAQRASGQLQLFEREVLDYLGREKPHGGQTVRLSRDYRGDARSGSEGRPLDPRVS